MRVNMDSSIATDARFKLMAVHLSRALSREVTWREVLGACFMVWLSAYERRSATLSQDEIDIAADITGFAGALIQVGLADQQRDDRVLLHGVKRRIEFLSKQSERGKHGGQQSGKTRKNKHIEANASGVAEANASDTAQAYSPSPSPSPSACSGSGSGSEELRPPIAPQWGADVGRSRRKPKPTDLTATEVGTAITLLTKLGAKNGVRYSGSQEHLRLIANQLREGRTEPELRAVIAYCAELWSDNDAMQKYMRPETLFGPKTIERYLDPARARFAKEIAEVERKRAAAAVPSAPQLQLVPADEGGSA